MVENFTNLSLSEIKLIRFIESYLHCGLTQRNVDSDEMVWSRGMFALLDLDPNKDKPSLSLLQSLQHPDDRLPNSNVESSFEPGNHLTRRYRVIRRDGTLRTLSQHGEVLFDSNGKPDRLLSIVQDVTDYESIRESAAANERRIIAFARDTGFQLNLLRPDGSITGTLGNGIAPNTALNQNYSYSWQELVHPQDRATTVAEFGRAVRDRVSVRREHRIKQSDENYRWCRTIWIPILDGQGKLTELGAVSYDIEKEKTLALSASDNFRLTGAQIRAARGMARWSVQQLAEAASVSPSLVRRVEEFDGVTDGVEENLVLIGKALFKAGIEFIFPEIGKPGIRPV